MRKHKNCKETSIKEIIFFFLRFVSCSYKLPTVKLEQRNSYDKIFMLILPRFSPFDNSKGIPIIGKALKIFLRNIPAVCGVIRMIWSIWKDVGTAPI